MEKALVVIIIIALLTIGFGVGVLVGQQSVPEKEYTIEPYTGMGSGVLAPGTIVKEDYKDPSSILGRVEGGVYILKEVE